MQVTLLGPQRRPTRATRSLGRSTGRRPLATVTAGWQEREPDDAELRRPARRPRRQPGCTAGGSTSGAGPRVRRRRARAPSRPRRAAAAVPRPARPRARGDVRARAARRRAARAVAAALGDADGPSSGCIDERHLEPGPRRPARLLLGAPAPQERPVVAEHRAEVRRAARARPARSSSPAATSASWCGCCTCSTCGRSRPETVVAWSAGAMALTERVVLFHDRAPQAPAPPRSTATGSALVRGCGAAAARPAAAAHRRPAADAGARPPVRAGALRRARRRGPGRPRRRTASCPPERACSATTAASRRAWRRRDRPPPTAPPARLAINRLRERMPLDARGRRPVPRAPRDADRRGRALHVPVPRRGRRGAAGAADRRAARTGCRCAGSRTPTCGTSCSSCPRARGSSTRSRSVAATHRERFNDPLNPQLVAQPDGQLVGVLRATATRCRNGPCRTRRRGPASSSSCVVAEQGAAPRLRGDALPAGPVPARRRLPAAGRPRRRRLPPVRRRQDRARQPHPPPRRRRDGRRVPASRRPADGVRRTRPRTARFVTRRAACPSSRPSCRWSAQPSGRCLLGSSFGAVASLSAAEPVPGHLRLAGADVRVVRVHRHRHRPRRRPGRSTRW